jgi:hypothetical protein
MLPRAAALEQAATRGADAALRLTEDDFQPGA